MNKITSCVIAAAGKGLRVKEYLNGLSKEMIPVNNIPAIKYLIDEALSTSIKKVYVVVHKEKKDLINYLNSLIKDGYPITLTFQEIQNGISGALYTCKDLIKEEYFSLFLGDDLFLGINAIKQLINTFNKTNSNVIGIRRVLKKNIHLYSSLKLERVSNNTFKCLDIIEKPQDTYFSSYSTCGRYILSKEVFSIIAKYIDNVADELGITEIIKELIPNVYARILKGERLDMGLIDDIRKFINV